MKDLPEDPTEIENHQSFFTVKSFAKKNKELGTWPSSELIIWGLRSGSPENGFGKVFLKVGRRVLVNEKLFWEAVHNLQD
jgi:hypothetical protein